MRLCSVAFIVKCLCDLGSWVQPKTVKVEVIVHEDEHASGHLAMIKYMYLKPWKIKVVRHRFCHGSGAGIWCRLPFCICERQGLPRAICRGDHPGTPEFGHQTGVGQGLQLASRYLCNLVVLLAVIFDWYMMSGTGDGSGQLGATDMAQIAAMLQQIAQEQGNQRQRLDDLGQAAQGTGAAVHVTQQVTEQVVAEVVQQVQSGFAREQQQQQDQLTQMIQAHQATQTQLQHMVASLADMQNRVGQVFASASAGAGSAQGRAASGDSRGSPTAQADGTAGQGTVPPAPPFSGPVGGGPRVYNIGGGSTGASMSPAVAYAIQQGAVDGRSLGKPALFNPQDSKVSFQDWTDSVITLCDSSMPGVYEVLEDIVHKQPKVNMDLNSIKTLYEHMDQLLLEYANTDVYAILSTYTSGEARSLVRQARRPNGFEAFRLLQVRFNPVTIGRQRAQLIKITNPQEGISLDKLAAEIVAWENKIVDYENRPGAERVSDAMQMAALVHMSPHKLREHLQLLTQCWALRNVHRAQGGGVLIFGSGGAGCTSSHGHRICRCGERRRMLFVWRSAFDEGQGPRQERWRRQRQGRQRSWQKVEIQRRWKKLWQIQRCWEKGERCGLPQLWETGAFQGSVLVKAQRFECGGAEARPPSFSVTVSICQSSCRRVPTYDNCSTDFDSSHITCVSGISSQCRHRISASEWQPGADGQFGGQTFVCAFSVVVQSGQLGDYRDICLW